MTFSGGAPAQQTVWSYSHRRSVWALLVVILVGLGTAAMLVALGLGKGQQTYAVPVSALFLLGGAALAVVCVLPLFRLKAIRSAGVDVTPAGVQVRTGRLVVDIPWQQVRAVRFRVLMEIPLDLSDLVSRSTYPRLELCLHDPAGLESRHPATARMRLPRGGSDGYTHMVRLGVGPFLTKNDVRHYLPELQQVLTAVAGPVYHGADIKHSLMPATA